MPRAHIEQTSFTAGELSPRLDARTDLKRYKEGLSLLVNGLVRVQGGVERRAGTRFIASTKIHTKKSILIPFEFSDEQAYIIEAGDLYFRFYMNSGQILSGGSPYEIATPYTEADLGNLWYTQSADKLFLVHPRHPPYELTRTGHAAWTLTAVPFEDGPYLDPNTDSTKTLTVSAPTGTGVTVTATGHTPFQAGHVGSVWRFTQGGVSGWFKVTGFTSATQVTADIQGDGLAVINVTANAASRKLRPATSANQRLAQGIKQPAPFSFRRISLDLKRNGTLTGSTIWLEVYTDNGGTPGALVAVSEVVDAQSVSTSGGLVQFNFANAYTISKKDQLYWLVLVGNYAQSDTNCVEWRGSATDVYGGDSVKALEQNNSNAWVPASGLADFSVVQTTSPDWQEGAWSAVRGYPRVVTLTPENRAVYAATDHQPQTLWFSKTNDWVTFTPGADADSPITVTLASTKVNVIRWLFPSKRGMLVGTLGEEFEISSSSGPMTVTTIRAVPQTAYGAAPLRPVAIGSSPIFVQRSTRRLRELVFDFNTEAYVGADLSLLAEHLFRQYGVVDLAPQREPTPILWCVREDGVLLGLTYEKAEQIFGWHRHTTAGKFERLAVIPHPDGDRDQVWCIVKRIIGGQTKRYVEVFEEKDGYYETFETDSSLQYVGAPTAAVSGLSHLEGQTVHILGDGAVHPPQVVTGGAVALQKAASVIEVGLPYTTTMQTVRPELSLADGPSQGRRRRLAKPWALLIDTLGGTLQGEELPFRSSADPMDQPPALFTGTKIVPDTGWDRDGFITFVQTQPLPAEVLALGAILTVEDM